MLLIRKTDHAHKAWDPHVRTAESPDPRRGIEKEPSFRPQYSYGAGGPQGQVPVFVHSIIVCESMCVSP